jgi:hypothetical protein
MGVKYAAGFDLNYLTSTAGISLVLEQATKTSVTISVADFSLDLFVHDYVLSTATTHDGVTMFSSTWASTTFAAALTAAINYEANNNGWTCGVTVTFSATTGRYTFTRSAAVGAGTGTYTVTFGNNPSKALLGFAANSATAETHVGTLTPTFWIDATLDGRSLDLEGDFEPESVADLAISDDGTAFAGIARTTTPKYRTWVQQFELKRKVFKAFDNGTDVWTFEDLWEHCRCEMPFVVDDGVDQMVCVFLPASSSFRGKQRPGGPADDVHFNLPFAVWHAADIA